MLNNIILIGRTVRDIEVKDTTNGRPHGIVTIAVQRSFKNETTREYDVDFIDVSLWGNTAENTAKYVGKGSAISIRGRITNRTIEIDGFPPIRSSAVTADAVHFISLKAPGVTHVQTDEIEKMTKLEPETNEPDELLNLGTFDSSNYKQASDSEMTR